MRHIIILALCMLMGLNATAQRNKEMQERIKAQKVAFITERLELTPKEAQEFWPIYNAFEDKTNDFRRNDLKGVREAMRRGDLSNSEAQEILNKYMAVEDKLHNAKKQLVKDLGNVLPPQKIIKLKSAEDAFNRKLMDMLRENRKKRQGNNEPKD